MHAAPSPNNTCIAMRTKCMHGFIQHVLSIHAHNPMHAHHRSPSPITQTLATCTLAPLFPPTPISPPSHPPVHSPRYDPPLQRTSEPSSQPASRAVSPPHRHHPPTLPGELQVLRPSTIRLTAAHLTMACTLLNTILLHTPLRDHCLWLTPIITSMLSLCMAALGRE